MTRAGQATVARYRRGTQRLVDPEETLLRIASAVTACGITRCTEVTWLDTIGIPVYCAIRPQAAVLQVSNGKGSTPAAAKVSALMEAIELHHAEFPSASRLRRASVADLTGAGQRFLPPHDVPGYHRERYWSDRLQIEWIDGHDLVTGEPVLLPASAVCFLREPGLHFTTTNGLASGNHVLEATLHAIYELIERDAAAALLGHANVPFGERTRVIDSSSIDDPDLSSMIRAVERAGSRLVLLCVRSAVPVHTFWAVLLNDDSRVSGTTFNTGWGTHLDVRIAAARAITEAAQSRATMIHGAREDAVVKPVFRDAEVVRESRAYRYFTTVTADAQWSEMSRHQASDSDRLDEHLRVLLSDLTAAGHHTVVCCDLTQPAIGVPVVKVVIPSLALHYR